MPITIRERLEIVGSIAGLLVCVAFFGVMFWNGFVVGPMEERRLRSECVASGGHVKEIAAAGKAYTEFGITHPSCEPK
jgi:hypothetical protein